MKPNTLLFLSFLLSLPFHSFASCQGTQTPQTNNNKQTLTLKFIAIASILVAGAIGVLLPILGRKVSALQAESDAFFIIKAFAAGVILATGLIHILPNAFERLTSPCLGNSPWQDFPIAGFVAMASAMGTLMVDSFATGYYKRSHFRKARPVDDDDSVAAEGGHAGHVHVHTHATHGHAHGQVAVGELAPEGSMPDRIRHRVISQVLELGIVVHSVIIGISLGTSNSLSTIRPLVGALSFHQFFEGIGLGGCIVQANFKARATVIMSIFFSLTTPIGIAMGIGISSSYNANSSAALAVEGIFNAASAGILIYMALVDLLAADFMSHRMHSNGRLQLGAHLALLLGAAFMSLLAIWA